MPDQAPNGVDGIASAHDRLKEYQSLIDSMITDFIDRMTEISDLVFERGLGFFMSRNCNNQLTIMRVITQYDGVIANPLIGGFNGENVFHHLPPFFWNE